MQTWAETTAPQARRSGADFNVIVVGAGFGDDQYAATIEQHVDWIADCIGDMRERNFRRIEATQDAETAWVGRGNEIAAGTLFPTTNSRYLGAGSRACSWPISAFCPMSKNATKSRRAAIRALR